jgi:4-amino-4-deoxy-L-arabinose transferase-like glycosyltransferase
MTSPDSPSTPPALTGLRSAFAVGLGLAAVKVTLHLWLIERYGYHRDELYFIECGKRLAFGYVDHAPFVPWVAAVAGVFDHHLIALRLPSVLAGAASILMTVLLARAWGGGAIAQLVSGLSVLSAPAFLRMSKILCIPVFEPLYWTGCALVLTRILHGGSPKLWLAVGAIAGIGLLTKHSMLFWALGLAVGTLLTASLRSTLRTPWPWLGAVVAIALFSPNLVWQAQNDWATLEFLRAISQGMLAQIPRALYVAGQVLYMNPLTLPVWLGGLWFLFSERGRRYRPFGWLFLTVFFVQLALKSKPYYLAAAYPPLFAAGGLLVERMSRRKPWFGRAAVAEVGAAVALGVLLSLPVFSLETTDRLLARAIGWAVPPIALTHDLHDEYGWREQAQTLARIRDSALTPDERSSTIVLTGNYGEASAVQFFGPDLDLPRAASGHMNYYLWNLPVADPAAVIAYGLPAETLNRLFEEVAVVGELGHPLAHPAEQHVPVYRCRRPRQPLREAWPSLKRYGNAVSTQAKASPSSP